MTELCITHKLTEDPKATWSDPVRYLLPAYQNSVTLDLGGTSVIAVHERNPHRILIVTNLIRYQLFGEFAASLTPDGGLKDKYEVVSSDERKTYRLYHSRHNTRGT